MFLNGKPPNTPDDQALLINKKKNYSRSSIELLERSNNSILSNDAAVVVTPKKGERRLHVCLEILDTENNYIRILNLLVDMYKKPLEEMLKNGEPLLDANEIQTLFAKIPAIIQVHTYIRDQLNTLINDWKHGNLVGRIWAVGAADLERVYPPYVNTYDQALQTLDFCEEERPNFKKFLEYVEKSPDCQRNSLRDLLIRPVQRIPSVLLLLQELLKRTERSNPDNQWVSEAVKGIMKVLRKTNESKRNTENHHHFLEICQDIENLPADIVSSQREFVQHIDVLVLDAGDGVLRSCKGKTIGLFLFNDCVVIAKARQMSTNLLNSTINLGGTFLTANGCGPSTGTLTRTLTRHMSSRQMNFTAGIRNSLTRQMSFSGIRRRNSQKEKERKKYKLIEIYRFANFRTFQLEREHEILIVKIRDLKADELCLFQCTNGFPLDQGIEFFNNLIQRILSSSSREIALEEVTLEQFAEPERSTIRHTIRQHMRRRNNLFNNFFSS